MSSFADLKAKRSGRDGNGWQSTNDASTSTRKSHDASHNFDNNNIQIDGNIETTSLISNVPSTYKLDETFLEIRETKTAGRSLFTKKTVSPGTILLSRKPHITLLDKANLSNLCSNCMSEQRSAVKLQRCSGCKTVYYCSNECQKAQWKPHLHKLECSKLREWAENARKAARSELEQIPDTPVRAIGNLLALRQYMPIEWWEEIELLAGSPRPLTPSEKEQHGSLALAISRYLGLTKSESIIPTIFPSETYSNDPQQITSLLLSMVDKFGINSFSLTQPDLSNIGVAINPSVALINHSCDPNCAVVFPDGPTGEMKVIAFKRIEAGEELLSSYLDLTMPLYKRQQELRDQYKFECKCSACEQGKQGNDIRRSLRCSKSNCSGYIPLPGLAEMQGSKELNCVTCGTSRQVCLSDENTPRDGLVYAMDKAESLLDELSKPTYDPLTQKQMKTLSTTLQLLKEKHQMTTFSYPLLALHRHILERTLGNLSTTTHSSSSMSYSLARNTCSEILSGLDRIYPFGHPVRAVQRVVHSRLLGVSANVYDGEQDQEGQGQGPTSLPGLIAAYNATRSALSECEIAFGKTTSTTSSNVTPQLTRDIKEELVKLERDIGWRQTAQRQARERGY